MVRSSMRPVGSVSNCPTSSASEAPGATRNSRPPSSPPAAAIGRHHDRPHRGVLSAGHAPPLAYPSHLIGMGQDERGATGAMQAHLEQCGQGCPMRRERPRENPAPWPGAAALPGDRWPQPQPASGHPALGVVTLTRVSAPVCTWPGVVICTRGRRAVPPRCGDHLTRGRALELPGGAKQAGAAPASAGPGCSRLPER